MEFFKSLQILATSEYGVAIIWYSFSYVFSFMGLGLLLSFILIKNKIQHDKKFFYLCDIVAFLNILFGCGILLSSRYVAMYVFSVFSYLFQQSEINFFDTLTFALIALEAVSLCLLYSIAISQYFLHRERIYLNTYFLYSYILLYIIIGIFIFSSIPISEINVKFLGTYKILENHEMLNSVQAKVNYIKHTTQLSVLICFPILVGNFIKGSVRGEFGSTRYIHVFSYLLFISASAVLGLFIYGTYQ